MDKLQEARARIDQIDTQIAALFEERMQAVADVAAYKASSGMQVFDPAREGEILSRAAERVTDPALIPAYLDLQSSMMRISRTHQHKSLEELYVATLEGGYPIHIARGLISHVKDYIPAHGRVLIVSDSGVPSQYYETVAKEFEGAVKAVFPMGESSKTHRVLEKLHEILLQNGFTRKDAVIAVGGGVVGDVAGFAAATYMRGIPFYNIPTTLLSQVDSSVGGKTAVNLDGIKNVVGAFHQPSAVIIDPDVLDTLSPRDIRSGLAEIIKMGATCDEGLVALIEEGNLQEHITEIIRRAVNIKRGVVEQDEREGGLRRVLNFGHTIGHAVESLARGSLSHGECVAIGTLYLSSPAVKERLQALYTKVGLPIKTLYSPAQLCDAIRHDKKAEGDSVTCVWVEEMGSFTFRSFTYTEILHILEGEQA